MKLKVEFGAMTITRGVTTTAHTDGGMSLTLDGFEMRCNPMGRRILERLANGAPLSAVVAEISDEYKVDTATVSRDVSEFVNLLKVNLIIESNLDANNAG
jgi:hypothetical protein